MHIPKRPLTAGEQAEFVERRRRYQRRYRKSLRGFGRRYKRQQRRKEYCLLHAAERVPVRPLTPEMAAAVRRLRRRKDLAGLVEYTNEHGIKAHWLRPKRGARPADVMMWWDACRVGTQFDTTFYTLIGDQSCEN